MFRGWLRVGTLLDENGMFRVRGSSTELVGCIPRIIAYKGMTTQQTPDMAVLFTDLIWYIHSDRLASEMENAQ